jgi:hypothetical protein
MYAVRPFGGHLVVGDRHRPRAGGQRSNLGVGQAGVNPVHAIAANGDGVLKAGQRPHPAHFRGIRERDFGHQSRGRVQRNNTAFAWLFSRVDFGVKIDALLVILVD